MMTNSHFHVPQNPDEAVWFDVGVFKTLFSEVSHYFLGGDSDHTTGALGSRPTNTKEVKIYISIVLSYFLFLQTYQSFSYPNTSSDGPLLFFSPEEASWASGLPRQREAGTGPRSDLQVPGRRHQLLW